METYKILTGNERLTLETFIQLSQPQLNSNLARTAGLLTCVCRGDGWHYTVSYIVTARSKWQLTEEVSRSYLSGTTKPVDSKLDTDRLCWSTCICRCYCDWLSRISFTSEPIVAVVKQHTL